MGIHLDVIQAPKLETPTTSSGGSLEADTTYYYCVIAVGGYDSLNSYLHYFESPRSNIVEVTTDSTNKTVNLSWNAPTISQSGGLSYATYNNDNYAVLRSTTKSDLEGAENVPILINTSYTKITTTTNSFTDDNVTGGTADGIKSYFWYRPWGCPKIVTEGTTSGAPYTMKQLYDADLAGTLELLPEVEATDTPHRLYTQVNPANSKQLALDIIVTNYTSSGSVELTGKDAGGDSKSETVSITGNGTYTTTKTYASIDEDGIVCTGDYTLKIIQNRWGVVEPHIYQFGGNNGEIGTASWTLHASFYNETYFETQREHIFVSGGFAPGVDSTDSHFISGELSSSGAGKNGSHIMFQCRRWFAGMNSGLIRNMEFYGSQMHYAGNSPDIYGSIGSTATWYGGHGDWRTAPYKVKFIDSIWDIPCGSNGFLVFTGDNTPTLTRTAFVGYLQPRDDNATLDLGNMTIIDGAIAHQIDSNSEIKNLTIATNSYHLRYWGSTAYNFIYKNITFKGGTGEPYNEPYYWNNYRDIDGGTATFKSDLNLKVIDTEGNAISGATVVLTRSNGTQEGSETTDSDGEISPIEAVYTTCTIDRRQGNSTGYAQNNRGGLTPVVAGIVATNYTHTLTISKAGYQTYTSELDMSSQKELVIKLEKAVDLILPMGKGVLKNLDNDNPQNKYKWLKL